MGGITRTIASATDRWEYCWGFTTYSVRLLFESRFPGVRAESYGNALAATAFLHGLASEELRAAELEYHDPDYQLLVAIVAVKPGAGNHA
jgi:hypothetical protein